MRREKAQTETFYTTLDAYTAGFLSLKNITPELIQQKGKVVFLFNATEELYQELLNYNSGAVVEASRFAFAIKSLKSRIHSMRRNNENDKQTGYSR